MVNFGEVRRAELAKSTLLTSTLVPPRMFTDLLRSIQSGVRKATGSYRTYSIPGKAAALVPVFAVKDLPLNSNLGSCACSEGPALGQNALTMMNILN